MFRSELQPKPIQRLELSEAGAYQVCSALSCEIMGTPPPGVIGGSQDQTGLSLSHKEPGCCGPLPSVLTGLTPQGLWIKLSPVLKGPCHCVLWLFNNGMFTL